MHADTAHVLAVLPSANYAICGYASTFSSIKWGEQSICVKILVRMKWDHTHESVFVRLGRCLWTGTEKSGMCNTLDYNRLETSRWPGPRQPPEMQQKHSRQSTLQHLFRISGESHGGLETTPKPRIADRVQLVHQLWFTAIVDWRMVSRGILKPCPDLARKEEHPSPWEKFWKQRVIQEQRHHKGPDECGYIMTVSPISCVTLDKPHFF